MIKKLTQSIYVEAAERASLKWPFPSESKPRLRFVHAISPTGKGGVTIAYMKCADYDSSSMVKVAVAYCSKFDTFSKKIGVANATAKFEQGHTVTMPARRMKSDHTIPTVLRAAFWDAVVGVYGEHQ